MNTTRTTLHPDVDTCEPVDATESAVRAVADLSDDDLVDAIAARGLGAYDEEDDSFFETLCDDLGIDADADQQGLLHGRVASLIGAGKPLRGVGCTWFEITPAEWAKRIVGKSVEEIVAILLGSDAEVSR